MLPGGCFSSFPTEECYISALQTALRCWNPSPWGRDFYSRQLCPLKHQPVNWMGVGNTFGMQLHNHYSHTTATEDCCCNTLSLSLPGFISSHLIYADAGRPHKPSWHIQKKIFSGMRIKSNAMAEGPHPALQRCQLKIVTLSAFLHWIWLPTVTAHLCSSTAAAPEAEGECGHCRGSEMRNPRLCPRRILMQRKKLPRNHNIAFSEQCVSAPPSGSTRVLDIQLSSSPGP